MDGKTFVTLWQTSKSLGDFCRRAKTSPQNACNKAKKLRDLGVDLQVFRENTVKRVHDPREIQELKDLAVTLRPSAGREK